MRAFLRQFLAALTHSGPGYQPTPLPARGDHVETWLKAQRNRFDERHDTDWDVLDHVLDTYRLHADTRTPLNEHACDGAWCEHAEDTLTASTRGDSE